MRGQSASVGAFLRARRELIQPEGIGLARGPHRRVPGLRREEVARVAGISAEYYLRLEQGRDHQPSTQVLEALEHALQLDPDAMAYLHRLAYPPPRVTQTVTQPPDVRDAVRELLNQWAHLPAYVIDRHLDVVVGNDLAVAMAPGVWEPGVNLLEAVLAQPPDPSRTGRQPDPLGEEWKQAACALVAALRF
jgi:transcriptional regulator with XRE-family HTH domain